MLNLYVERLMNKESYFYFTRNINFVVIFCLKWKEAWLICLFYASVICLYEERLFIAHIHTCKDVIYEQPPEFSIIPLRKRRRLHLHVISNLNKNCVFNIDVNMPQITVKWGSNLCPLNGCKTAGKLTS